MTGTYSPKYPGTQITEPSTSFKAKITAKHVSTLQLVLPLALVVLACQRIEPEAWPVSHHRCIGLHTDHVQTVTNQISPDKFVSTQRLPPWARTAITAKGLSHLLAPEETEICTLRPVVRGTKTRSRISSNPQGSPGGERGRWRERKNMKNMASRKEGGGQGQGKRRQSRKDP